MRKRLLGCVVLVCALHSVGCRRASTVASTDAGAPMAAPLVLDAGRVVVEARARDAGARKHTATDRTAVVQALREGRSKAQKKDWVGALATFERGLVVVPEDATLLAETAWAAFQTKDLPKAEEAGKHALRATSAAPLRAQVLYTLGRVSDAKGDREAARKSYAASLALRDNAEVKRRLESAGGAPSAAEACAEADHTEAMCRCLLAHNELFLLGTKPVCRPLPVSLVLGTPRLTVLRWGAPEDDSGEAEYLLLARDGNVLRRVAELGRDYEPGALGVHNTSKVVGGEMRKSGGRDVFVVRSDINNLDMNLAGLEECFDNRKQETVCALGEGTRPTRCVPVPVTAESGCGPGVEPEPGDLSAKELLKERSVDWKRTSLTLSWAVAPDGKLVVTKGAGDANAPTASAVGSFPLF